MQRTADWVETGSADNATATATRVAYTKGYHHITKIIASYSTSSPSGLLVVKKGADTIMEYYVHGSREINFDNPIRGDFNESVSVELAASGGAGVVGKVVLVGFSD